MRGKRQYWLEDGRGQRVRVTPGGLVLGRDGQCAIVTANPQASRRHAIVLATGDGLTVQPLGRNPTSINGTPATAVVTVSEGDRVEIPGIQLIVREAAGEAPPSWWYLEGAQEGLLSIAHSPYTVGGGDDDDLHVPGWPAAALRFYRTGDSLVLEAVPGLLHNGYLCPADDLRSVAHGDSLALDDHQLRVLAVGGDMGGTTVVSGQPELPARAEFQFLPRGGLLTLEFAAGPIAVSLSELRADLVATLLAPPTGYLAGGLVPDELLLARVWPGQPEKSRRDLNLLVYWTRKALVQAGIDGSALIERAPGGGATRFTLATGAEVQLLD